MTRLNIIQDCTKFDRPLVLSMSCKSVSVCCNHNKNDLNLTKGASTSMLCSDTCVFLILWKSSKTTTTSVLLLCFVIRFNVTIPPAKMSLNLSFYVLFKLQSTFLVFAVCVCVCGV